MKKQPGFFTRDARDICPRWLVPQYDEQALFLMALAFLLLFLTEGDLRAMIWKSLDDWTKLREWLLAILVGLGLVAALVNPFVRRPKSELEKICLLFFAVILNAVSGLAAGQFLWERNRGWLLVFPLWNIINAAWLLLLFRFRIIDTDAISDDDTSLPRILAGSVVVTTTVAVTQLVGQTHWAIVFSMCVGYATSVDAALTRFTTRRFGPNP